MGKHQIAIWSGVAAFFSSILAIGAIDILKPSDQVRFISAIFVGLVTGLAIYARERLHDARDLRERRFDGQMIIEKQGEKKVFTLELENGPEALEKRDVVTFRVKRK